ncbi:SLBB domain-containing protein [Gemmatimonas aurantiaca]|uniref:polysaccharide biosynthesis/export family protein n=1 Tax=Gemmatimonas aurantiaca TaxID=173480 RepID=UPI00301BB245
MSKRQKVVRRVVVIAAGACLAGAGPLSAQTPVGSVATMQRASRADLAARVTQLEQQVASGALKGKSAEQANREIAEIKTRLLAGDFQVGDRFVITARMDSVRADTASVRDSLKVTVLNLPDITIAGVLRSELDERINAHVARYVRNVTVRTSVLTRVAILGAVARPGFYYAPPDRPVSDMVMLAGGPVQNANLNEFEVYRARARMLSAKESRNAVRNGTTLEQLDIRSGDEFRIPQKRKINWQLVIQLVFILSSLLFALINFLKWYYDRQE